MSLELDIIMQSDILAPAYYKGIAEGQVAGQEQAGRRTLERLLTHRFGPMPDWASTRIRQLSLEEIDRVFDQALDAASLEAALR